MDTPPISWGPPMSNVPDWYEDARDDETRAEEEARLLAAAFNRAADERDTLLLLLRETLGALRQFNEDREGDNAFGQSCGACFCMPGPHSLFCRIESTLQEMAK